MVDQAQQAYDAVQPVVWDIPSFEESNQAFELPDEGYYKFQMKDVGDPEPVLAQYDPSGTKKRALFSFQIIPMGENDQPDDNHGIVVRKWFTVSMNEKSSLYPFVKAMLGGKIDPAQRINPRNLIGKTFMGVVQHEEKTEGKVYPNITAPTVDKNPPAPF